MKKIINATLLAALLFIMLNFVYCNLNSSVFNYEIQFSFIIPHILTLKSVPMPLGFVLILAFALGIIFLAVLQTVPLLLRTGAIKARDKKIKILEEELKTTRKQGEEDHLSS